MSALAARAHTVPYSVSGRLSLLTAPFQILCVCVWVSLDNPSNFLVQERSFDEDSGWRFAKLSLADSP